MFGYVPCLFSNVDSATLAKSPYAGVSLLASLDGSGRERTLVGITIAAVLVAPGLGRDTANHRPQHVRAAIGQFLAGQLELRRRLISRIVQSKLPSAAAANMIVSLAANTGGQSMTIWR